MSKRAALLLALAALGLAALLWLFAPDHGAETAAHIETRAKRDVVDACNEAAEAAGLDRPFTLADVAAPRRETIELADGVSTFASLLEARRGDLRCRWNGIDPASIE